MKSAGFYLTLFLAATAYGQDVGSARGENAGEYNITDSFEAGYRGVTLGGNAGQYRSDLNYGDGIRLFSSSFTANSKSGYGKWFDSVSLTTQALGNDPYQSATLRIEKNRLYEYDFQWRQNDYFNPDLVLSGGEHAQTLEHRWQDQDLTLFPQRWYRVHAGFSDVTERGPALTTVHLDNGTGNEFPVFEDVRRQFYDYRLGVDLDVASWRFTVMRRWEDYRDDTPQTVTSLEPGDNPQSATHLSSFSGTAPYHGTTPGWLVNLNTTQRKFAVNGHFTYAGGARNFVMDELAIGPDRFSAAHRQETFAAGNASRPVTTGDLAVSLMTTARLTIVNNTSIQNTRIDGNSLVTQLDNGQISDNVLYFQFLGIRTVGNSTDLQFRFNDRLGVYVGYQYSWRQIRSIEDASVPGFPTSASSEAGQQGNHQHSGVLGVNWTIAKPLRLHVEGEIGRDDNPFFPIAARNFHAIDARIQYRGRSVRASAGYKQNYNNNSISLTAYSSRSRTWFGDVSWTASRRVGIDLSYNQLNVDSLGGIAFFASTSPDAIQSQSYYVSNIHAGNAVIRLNMTKRAGLLVGYSVTRDTGDGNTAKVTGDAVAELLSSVHSFPLSFQSPYARLSVVLTPKLRWNLNYQYYGYHEDGQFQGVNENFRAHVGSVSLTWAF